MRNDNAKPYPTWNSYIEQLRKYKEAHGSEPPKQDEIYAACEREGGIVWCPRMDDTEYAKYLLWKQACDSSPRLTAARQRAGLTWDEAADLLAEVLEQRAADAAEGGA